MVRTVSMPCDPFYGPLRRQKQSGSSFRCKSAEEAGASLQAHEQESSSTSSGAIISWDEMAAPFWKPQAPSGINTRFVPPHMARSTMMRKATTFRC